jgi:peroxiredoxin (alkyl hydroperoxide reductase subunit C)
MAAAGSHVAAKESVMTSDKKVQGCVAAAAGPIAAKSATAPDHPNATGKEHTMHVTVGKEAPDFEAAAFYQGGFQNIRLSGFRGKWVFLCFYPGDFTFV